MKWINYCRRAGNDQKIFKILDVFNLAEAVLGILGKVRN